METLISDIRYGLRSLLKRPGFTAIAVITLALGIGANTAIFSVINAVLLKPLPYPEPEQLVMVWEDASFAGFPRNTPAPANFADWREQNQVFKEMAALASRSFNLTGDQVFAQVAAVNMSNQFLRAGDEPERLRGAMVSADLFPLLAVEPLIGRAFSREEEQSGAPVIVLSHELWQRRFNSDPNIVGQSLLIGSQHLSVLGVMPEGFKFPVGARQVEFWMPLISSIPPAARGARGAVYLTLFARLKPNVIITQAQAEMDLLANRLATQYPEANTGLNVALFSTHDRLVGEVRPALLVLLGAVALVLLIACANVANLLLARASVRQKEIAIRMAIGATRWRIIRQLLTESLLLSLLGGVAGVMLALWAIALLVSFNPANLPRIAEIELDRNVLWFTVGLVTLTSLLFGFAPALQAARSDLNEKLKDCMRESSGGSTRSRTRSVLVVSEIALSLILLVGATLLFQSLQRLLEVSPGFVPANVLAADVSISTT